MSGRPKKIRETVQRIIQDQGWTLKEAGERFGGVSSKAVSGWLAGSKPHPRNLAAIAEIAGITVSELLGEDDSTEAGSDAFVVAFPALPRIPEEIGDEVTEDHLELRDDLTRLIESGKDWLAAAERRRADLEAKIVAALSEGASPEPGIVAQVEYTPRRRVNVSWLKVAREFASATLECPSCHADVPVTEDPKGWEKDLRERSVREVEEPELVFKREEK